MRKNLYHIGSNVLTVFGNKSKIPQTDEKVVILELFFGYLIEYLSVFKQSSASLILAQNINSHLKMEPAKRASQVRHLFLLALCHLTAWNHVIFTFGLFFLMKKLLQKCLFLVCQFTEKKYILSNSQSREFISKSPGIISDDGIEIVETYKRFTKVISQKYRTTLKIKKRRTYSESDDRFDTKDIDIVKSHV